jgi:methionine-rich copper-binding protein CopC
MSCKRLSVATVAVLIATAVLTTAIATAHVDVEKSSPKRGGSAKTSLSSVTVTFSGPIRRGTLRVKGPGGKVVSIGKGGRDPRKITRLITELKRSKRAGRYKASWTLVAADGHKQHGSFRFRLRA